MAAWIGLVPGQYRSGGKARLGRITKAGDSYLRSLLVMGARAILSGFGDKQDRFSRCARGLVKRRDYWKAVVAIAAKNARLAWAVLRYGGDFRLNGEAALSAGKSVYRNGNRKDRAGRRRPQELPEHCTR